MAISRKNLHSAQIAETNHIKFKWKLSGNYEYVAGHQKVEKKESEITEMPFASFLPSGFISVILVYPQERKLAKLTSVELYGN